MKKQNGFISSSSSVSITYSTSRGPSSTSWGDVELINGKVTGIRNGASWTTEDALTNESIVTTDLSWTTFNSTSYQRIEYFLEAVEKLNTPFSSNSNKYLNLGSYKPEIAERGLYSGFVDIVITFPTEIRLAGIELINPWVNKLLNSNESSYWKYLPSKFKIYKVDNSKTNDILEKVTYENSVANKMTRKNEREIRPIRFDQIDHDKNLIFLGNYEVNWENISSYKCFFKFNNLDPASVNLNLNDNHIGTATWKFKQLVLRIFETKATDSLSYNGETMSGIYYKICEYIYNNETKYGTTYQGNPLTIEMCKELIGQENISSENTNLPNWKFGSIVKRSYKYKKDVKFECGIKYKLGGIQLLLSPDIFSVSEMKMYHYADRTNNKVFIGEWNKDYQELEYYGTGLIKRSPNISIGEENIGSVKWKHNFNIPPKYLDVQMFAIFNIDFDSFFVGDTVTNLVNINKEPLTIKLTGDEVQVNLANGIGFTNPQTGEFMSFLNGVGVQMDRPGNFDALNAALAVGAKDYILDYGSNIGSKISGGYPFDIYFVVKRLF